MDCILSESNIKDFAEFLKEEEKSVQTIKKYERDITALKEFLNGEQVSKEEIVKWKEHMLDSGYAVCTVNSMLAAVNRYMTFAGRQDLRVKRIRHQKDIFRSRERELSKEEYFRLLKTAKEKENFRLYYLMETIGATGIRISELQYITAESLNIGRASVRSKGKTRTVILTKRLCTALKKYCKEKGIYKGPVFVTRSGKPVNRSNVWREMQIICREAGVACGKVFPHNFRHLFAVTYYKLKKDMSKLADMLGHSSIETTRIYIMENGDEHQRQIEKLGLVI